MEDPAESEWPLKVSTGANDGFILRILHGATLKDAERHTVPAALELQERVRNIKPAEKAQAIKTDSCLQSVGHSCVDLSEVASFQSYRIMLYNTL